MGPILHIRRPHDQSERTIGDDPVRAGLRRNDAEAHTWNSRPGGLGLRGKAPQSCGDIVRHIAAAAEPPTYAAGLRIGVTPRSGQVRCARLAWYRVSRWRRPPAAARDVEDPEPVDLARDLLVPLALAVAEPADEVPVPIGLDVASCEVGIPGHHHVSRHRPLEVPAAVAGERHVGRCRGVAHRLGRECRDEIVDRRPGVVQVPQRVARVPRDPADIPDAEAHHSGHALVHDEVLCQATHVWGASTV